MISVFKLDHNWKFDYILTRLLYNTEQTILSYAHSDKISEIEKKILVFLTIGASLHTVEDFYSHTDWTHMDFARLGFPKMTLDDGKDRAPTWFEVRKKFGAPNLSGKKENWHFRLSVGEYPPKDSCPESSFGIPLSHTLMNHDNSQLYYDNAYQIKFHKFGAHPATDSASAAEHQLYAYRTACGAAIEWIALLEKNTEIKNIIEDIKDLDLKKLKDDDYADDLDDGLSSVIIASCIMQKWDGNKPPPDRDKICNTGKLIGHIHIPKLSNKFWGCFPKYAILENLTAGFGSTTGEYAFDPLWIKQKHEKLLAFDHKHSR